MEKLGNQQTKELIADKLREEILSGRFADGDELGQEQLAEILQVSRMPVREALQTLEVEGFLIRLPNRRMRVVELSDRTIYENMRLVAAVETEIIMILLERKEKILTEIHWKDDRHFHQWISNQADNPYMQQIHKRLLNGYPEYVWKNYQNENFSALNRHIWGAIAGRDTVAARQWTYAYYHELAQELLSHAKEKKDE